MSSASPVTLSFDFTSASLPSCCASSSVLAVSFVTASLACGSSSSVLAMSFVTFESSDCVNSSSVLNSLSLSVPKVFTCSELASKKFFNFIIACAFA